MEILLVRLDEQGVEISSPWEASEGDIIIAALWPHLSNVWNIGGLPGPNIPILFALVWLVHSYQIFAKLKVKNANQFITFPNRSANQIDRIPH
jgi:hypothetical protein